MGFINGWLSVVSIVIVLIMRVLCKLVINKRWDWMGLDGTGWGLDNGIKCGISNLGRLSNKSIGG